MLPGQAADELAGLLIGPGRDRAGVDQDQVRQDTRGDGAPSLRSQFVGQARSVALVHLAAESDDAEKPLCG
jgi:hypothetical protein